MQKPTAKTGMCRDGRSTAVENPEAQKVCRERCANSSQRERVAEGRNPETGERNQPRNSIEGG